MSKRICNLLSKRIFFFAALTALLTGSPAAFAEEQASLSNPSGLYISLFGGVTFVDDYDANLAAVSLSAELDTGYVFGFAVGTHILPNLRAELEYSYAQSDLDNLSLANAGVVTGTLNGVGEGELQTFLVNVWYDLASAGSLTPYIGGGIGYGHVKINDLGPLGDSDSGFAFQLGAGVSYAVSEKVNLDLSYRFKDVLGVEVIGISGFSDDDLQSHNIQAAITYKLN